MTYGEAKTCYRCFMSLGDLAFWMRDKCVEQDMGNWHSWLGVVAKGTVRHMLTPEQWIRAAAKAWDSIAAKAAGDDRMMNDRTEICRIISEMLDNPDKHGIYPTSTAYTKLELYIEQVRMEAIGWMYAYACVALDKGNDPRTIEVPKVIEDAMVDLGKAAKAEGDIE